MTDAPNDKPADNSPSSDKPSGESPPGEMPPKTSSRFKKWEWVVLLFSLFMGCASAVLLINNVSLRALFLGWEDDSVREQVAVLDKVGGIFKRQFSNGSDFSELEISAPLFNRDTVVTGPNSSATLLLDDGTKIDLDANTMVRLSFEKEVGLGGISRSATVDVVVGQVTGQIAEDSDIQKAKASGGRIPTQRKILIKSADKVINLVQGKSEKIVTAAPALAPPKPKPSRVQKIFDDQNPNDLANSKTAVQTKSIFERIADAIGPKSEPDITPTTNDSPDADTASATPSVPVGTASSTTPLKALSPIPSPKIESSPSPSPLPSKKISPSPKPKPLPKPSPSPSPKPKPSTSPMTSPSPSPKPPASPSPKPESNFQNYMVSFVTPKQKATLVFDPGTNPPSRTFELSFNISPKPTFTPKLRVFYETESEEILNDVIPLSNGLFRYQLTLAKPGNYTATALSDDGSILGKLGNNLTFVLNSSIKGIEVNPYLISGQVIRSNLLTGKQLSDFDVGLSWKPFDGSSEYSVAVYDPLQGTFPGKQIAKALTGETHAEVLKNQIINGTYYYRISSQLSTGAEVTSGWQKIEFQYLPPKASIPEEGAKISLAQISAQEGGILMTWQKTSFTDNYVIEISADASFTKVGIRQSIADNFFLLKKPPVGTYYWRIRSQKAKVTSKWSKPMSFSVVQ